MIKINYAILAVCFSLGLSAQNGAWSTADSKGLTPAKTTLRQDFPKTYKLYQLNASSLTAALQQAPERNISVRQTGVEISVPTVSGQFESFRVLEASNFEPGFQAQFPQIRAYVGTGVNDPNAILRLSISPKGIQAMMLRAGSGTEFIERYADNQDVYAVFHSERVKGALPFVCSTEDHKLTGEIAQSTARAAAQDNLGDYKTFRLALSCNGEYAQYFGGQVSDAVTAMNNTMTRVNGVFEKDFATHLSIITGNSAVVYTNAATDPYSTNMNAWNGQLQSTLTSVIGEANYDIGHMFGATGGGGDAGCIGCVCVNNSKGSGITSPSDGVPSGDTFDIDYVAHEMGHQLGANHTYTTFDEGTGVNIEPGAGSTIMGYAGLYEGPQFNSDDYFSVASIVQVQNNLATKTCPVRTPIAGSAPTVSAGADYIIPYSTPFILTADGADADGDVLSYCWEQNDNVTSSTSGDNSACYPTKTGGPNFRSFDPVASNARFFPRIQSVVANNLTTTTFGFVSEAVSSIARELNFAVTVRDVSAGVGRTATDYNKLTVTTSAGPFQVTSPNTSGSYPAGSNTNVTWNVAGTTANGVNTPYVDIYLSTNSGTQYPTLLASRVPNDGSETVTLPNTANSLCRIMVRGHNHVFYDISNSNFSVAAPTSTFAVGFNQTAGEQNKSICQGQAITYTFPYTPLGGFTGSTTFSVAGQPTGATVTFSPATISAAGNVTMTVTPSATSPAQFYSMTVTATSGSITKTIPYYLDVLNGNFATATLQSPANGAIAQSVSPVFNWSADAGAAGYDVQVATDAAFSNVVLTGESATNSFTGTGLEEGTEYFWRVRSKNVACQGSFSSAFSFETGQTVCDNQASADVPKTITAGGTPTVNSTLVVSGAQTLSDLTVLVNLNHTYVSDLTLTLTSPSGTAVTLIQNPCNDQNNMSNVTFTDNGGEPLCAAAPAVTGNIRPTQPLSNFYGENPNGEWRLTIQDGESGDGGILFGWSLNFCGEVPLGVADQKLNNLSIYPNPNSGSFNVSFTPNQNADVKINVFDVRGRNIYGKSFESSGLFQQTLDLGSPSSGIYMVQIENGNVRETRKIVIK